MDADEDKLNSKMEYFINEQGRYYQQPFVDNQNNQTPRSPVAVDTQNLGQIYTLKMSDPFTIKHSERCITPVSYIIETNIKSSPFVNVDFYMDEPEGESEDNSADDYAIMDKEGGKESSEKAIHVVSAIQEEPKRQYNAAQHKQYKFKCALCSYTCQKQDLLLHHYNIHAMDYQYTCYICNKGFNTAAALQNHVNMHTSIKPFNCKHCNNRFTTSDKLVRHVRYRHTLVKPYLCNECDYSTVEASKLRRHNMSWHSGERPFQCRFCTYTTTDTFRLSRHLRTHTGEKPYKCEICNKQFKQSNTLKEHNFRVHKVGSKPVYACELCPTKCSRRGVLRNHVRELHGTDKLYKCNRCGIHFTTKYSFKEHRKIHKGEKCFKCDVCSFATQKRSTFISHMRIHSGEKPFTCDHCQRSFREKQQLSRHLNSTKHNPAYKHPPPKEKAYACHRCHKKYFYKAYLLKHIKAKHHSDEERQTEMRCSNTNNQVECVNGVPLHTESSANDDIVRGDIIYDD